MDLNPQVSDMQVCFVLPTYNEEGNIKEIIQDILAVEVDLGGPVFSILVVDDNSKDRTQEIVRDIIFCLLYTSPSPRDQRGSRMPSSA